MKLSVVFSALLLLATTSLVSGHAHEAYYWSKDPQAVAHNPRWMSYLPDETLWTEMSIPGTHDTMANCLKGTCPPANYMWARTQSMTLEQQLNSGVRVVDIRIKYDAKNDAFTIWHGPTFMGTELIPDVIRPLMNFLEANPSEAVMMNLSDETREDHQLNDLSILERLAAKLKETGFNDIIVPRFQKDSWDAEVSDPLDIPTLGQVRGKVILHINPIWGCPDCPYDEAGVVYSINNWDVGGLSAETRTALFIHKPDPETGKKFHLYDKWERVKSHLFGKGLKLYEESAVDGSRTKWYWTGLNISNKYPWFGASGHAARGTNDERLSTGYTTPGWKNKWPDFPRTSCFLGICTISYEGLNILVSDYIEKMTQEKILNGRDSRMRLGTIVFDHPGDALIENVIFSNLVGAVYPHPEDPEDPCPCKKVEINAFEVDEFENEKSQNYKYFRNKVYAKVGPHGTYEQLGGPGYLVGIGKHTTPPLTFYDLTSRDDIYWKVNEKDWNGHDESTGYICATSGQSWRIDGNGHEPCGSVKSTAPERVWFDGTCDTYTKSLYHERRQDGWWGWYRFHLTVYPSDGCPGTIGTAPSPWNSVGGLEAFNRDGPDEEGTLDQDLDIMPIDPEGIPTVPVDSELEEPEAQPEDMMLEGTEPEEEGEMIGPEAESEQAASLTKSSHYVASGVSIDPSSNDEVGALSAGAIAGIVVGALVVIVGAAAIVVNKKKSQVVVAPHGAAITPKEFAGDDLEAAITPKEFAGDELEA